jgi:ABC-type antimicrobial peptide transport system permease subunit
LSFDIFNATAASSLGIQRIADPRVLLGIQFHMRLGDSFFTKGLSRRRQWTRVGQLVGFSDKSPLVGLTAPRNVVESINTFYAGRASAQTYDTVILVTHDNADVSRVIHAAEQASFRLAPRSRQARKLANMLRILTQVFAAIGLVIIFIAAINIAHTFLMMVTERRTELGIMRALGATSVDVRLMILTEAAFVGLMAGIGGHLFAYGASRLANQIIAGHLSSISFLPDDFFIFEFWFLGVSVLGAMVFAVVGALSAARKAARLDPAEVLTSP